LARKSVVVRLAGESGEGVISSGDILTQAAARGGYWTQTFRTYPAEIKGGPCMYQVRMGEERIYSHGKHVDLLVCFNQEAWTLHWDSLAPDGVILYDDTAVEIPEAYLPRARAVRMEKLAKEIGGSLRAKNMVAVGAVSEVISFDTTPIEQLVLRRYAHKQGVADANIAALRAGGHEADDLAGSLAITPPVEVEEDRILMSGNQALAVGAVAAGLKYFAGYPITPASDILEWLSAKLPQVGGITIQCEDEIASLCSVLGASYTGTKAMTATSGPGLSLMTEVLGFAGTAEIPCVIVDAQRGGPSTGLPTKTEQSDLQHALYGGHGEAPRVVIAPISVEDCFWAAIDAFNYSERFQVPVILLTDQGLATRMEVIHKPDTSRIELWERTTSAGLNGDYKRYEYTPDWVSPMGIPGEEGGQYVATGIEHDEWGHPGYTPEIHVGMQTKRWAKLEPLKNGVARHERYGDPQPTDVAVIGFGSTYGPVREAVDMARAEGLSVGAFYPRVLGPFPADAVREFAAKARRVLVPEVNFTGQLARLVRGECALAVDSRPKSDGLPFTAEDIRDIILERTTT
jgi:2-oxoglutarate ferredoxin oxidoreductase subunit alpha